MIQSRTMILRDSSIMHTIRNINFNKITLYGRADPVRTRETSRANASGQHPCQIPNYAREKRRADHEGPQTKLTRWTYPFDTYHDRRRTDVCVQKLINKPRFVEHGQVLSRVWSGLNFHATNCSLMDHRDRASAQT